MVVRQDGVGADEEPGTSGRAVVGDLLLACAVGIGNEHLVGLVLDISVVGES